MRLLLGKIPEEGSHDGFGFFLNLFYKYGILYMGLVIGTVIAVLYMLIDYFVLRKKLNNDWITLLIRISILLFITLTVGIIHYFLEKIVDVI